MAKKAKKAKKVKKAKKASAAKKSKPTTVKRQTATPVTMEAIVQFVRMLVNEGRDGAFETHVRQHQGAVTLSDANVEVVKQFFNQHGDLRGTTMRGAIREPCPGNPFEC
jgi:hypothetical protein